MATTDNLKAAFAGESQANRRYLAFAKKAEEEGFKNIARIFRAAAESETVHALNHLSILGEVKSTKENLEAAAKGESYEFMEMYPKFIEEAEKEKDDNAKRSFYAANEAEKVHEALYKKAIEGIGKGKDIEKESYFVCSVCGYTMAGKAPDKCPICGAPKKKFKKI